jgi:hypothetical protein
MRPIIEAHLVDAEGSAARIQLATIDRVSTTDPIGMSLGEGKALLAAAQQYLVYSQCQGIGSAHAHCGRCDARLGAQGLAPTSDQNGVWFGQCAKSPSSALSLCEQTREGFFQPSHAGGAHQHDIRA